MVDLEELIRILTDFYNRNKDDLLSYPAETYEQYRETLGFLTGIVRCIKILEELKSDI
jgi:hypothetical protein